LPWRESGLRALAGENDNPHADHEHEGEGADPHIWLDPVNAIVITEALVAQLSALDPGHAAAYRANGARQVERLAALDAELAAQLAPVAAVPFMTFHDAFQYFETAYELNGVAAVAISPDRAPGGRTVAGLREAIGARGVACVFAEPQFEPRLVATLIEGTGARPGTLDPLGGEVPAGPAAYDTLMRRLGADALACLGAATP
jgi:zinc transport system substrate-binding protein